MQSRHKKLAREQLDATLSRFVSLRTVRVPVKGWIRAIRETLGMTGEQLARRMGTNKQRVSRIEQDEIKGRLTMATLERVASALNCTLVYGLVPYESLEETVRKQARLLAIKRFQRSNQMMRLEKQELSKEEKTRIVEELVQEIIDDMPKVLWEDR